MSTRLQRLLCICSSASAAALLAAPVFAQTGTLDQVSPFTNASYNGNASSLTWQAQVRAGLSGQLEGIELTLQGNAGAQLRVGIRLGDAEHEVTFRHFPFQVQQLRILFSRRD